MGNEKKLTIIIPLYNVAKYVARAAESITNQRGVDFKHIEIIAVDDGSTDHSLKEIVSHFTSKNLHIRAMTQENTGPGGARNTGIQAATGKYIMFLDGDDFYLPNTFRNIFAIIERPSPPNIIYGNYIRWMEGHGYLQTTNNSWNSAWRYICCREFILENALLFEPTMYCEDMKWVLELLDKGESATIVTLPAPFYAYNYRRPDSIMNSTNPKRVIDLIAIVSEALEGYKTKGKYTGQKILGVLGGKTIGQNLRWQAFYYVNEYCTFKKHQRKEIYAGYKKAKLWCYHPLQFWTMSAMLYAFKQTRRLLKYNKRNMAYEA